MKKCKVLKLTKAERIDLLVEQVRRYAKAYNERIENRQIKSKR